MTNEPNKKKIKIFKICFVESYDSDGYTSTIIPSLLEQSPWMEVTDEELNTLQLFIKTDRHPTHKYNEQYVLVVQPEHSEYEQLMSNASKFAQEWKIKEEARLEKEKKKKEEAQKKDMLAREKRKKKQEEKEKKLLEELSKKYK